MNSPFTLTLAVEEINLGTAPSLQQSTIPVRTTLSHTVGDIRGAVWRQSPEHRIKPLFISIYSGSTKVYDQETLTSVFNVPEVPQGSTTLRCVIDYLLYGLPAVPMRDPPEELFDILVYWEDDRGHENHIHIRESLDCTIGSIQDYIAEERSKTVSGPRMNREYFGLLLQPSGEYISNSSLCMRDVLHLDVTPLRRAVFRIRFNQSEQVAFCRFHIKINSDIPLLQQFNLVEVNNRTTVRELKQQLIASMDESSVRRTFYEQLELSYAAHSLENTPSVDDSRLYDVLSLNRNTLYEHGNIVPMDLRIRTEEGILSRQFWNDLRSPDRFNFLPRSGREREQNDGGREPQLNHGTNALQGQDQNQHQSHEQAAEHNEHTARQSEDPQQPLAVEPMRIVLDTGEEWQLTGSSYEMITRTRPSSSTNISKESLLLVNQSDLSSINFDFTLDVNGVAKTVLLNTSQCIVVNQGNHHPYVLLSPAGLAKLDSVFRNEEGSMIQQVRVLLHAPEHHRAPAVVHVQNEQLGEQQNDGHRGRQQMRLIFNLYERLRVHFRDTVLALVRYAFILHLIGIDRLLLKVWQPVLTMALIGSGMYVLFMSGSRVTDLLTGLLPERDNAADRRYDEIVVARAIQGLRITNSLLDTGLTLVGNELITTAVKRTREFDLFMNKVEGNDTFYTLVAETFTNLWKDALLFALSTIPRLQTSIEEALEAWRDTEVDDLETEVVMFQELIVTIIEIYDKKNDISDGEPARNVLIRETNIDYALITPAGTTEETEERYQQLLQYYIKMQPVYEKFDRCVRLGVVLEEGRRQVDAGAETGPDVAAEGAT